MHVIKQAIGLCDRVVVATHVLFHSLSDPSTNQLKLRNPEIAIFIWQTDHLPRQWRNRAGIELQSNNLKPRGAGKTPTMAETCLGVGAGSGRERDGLRNTPFFLRLASEIRKGRY